MKARDIRDVIDAILVNVPTDQTDFIERLTKISNDSVYNPPEDKWPAWYKLNSALVEEIGEYPTLDWHFAVCSTVTMKPEEQIRAEVEEFLKGFKNEQ